MRFLQLFQAAREVDFRVGVERLGSLPVYIGVLRTYQKSTEDRVRLLPGLLKDDFTRFVIEAHGLKGASAAIGAMGISGLAEGLEHRGREKDIAGAAAELPYFLERTKKSLIEVEEFIRTFDAEQCNVSCKTNSNANGGANSTAHGASNSAQDGRETVPLTTEMLDRLEQAFLDFDTEQLKGLFEELEENSHDKETQALLDSLKENYESYEFEQPISRIAAYREIHFTAQAAKPGQE